MSGQELPSLPEYLSLPIAFCVVMLFIFGVKYGFAKHSKDFPQENMPWMGNKILNEGISGI